MEKEKKWSIDDCVKYLEEKYMFNSSFDASQILALCKWYKENGRPKLKVTKKPEEVCRHELEETHNGYLGHCKKCGKPAP